VALFATSPHQGADGLAQALVDAGLLTPYQVEAIREGRQGLLRAGNYDVLGRIGVGGMGTVYKARHRRMKRIVALKALSAELCQDVTFVRRFQREVEFLARLSHPNIVIAHDANEAELGHFLVMEYVEGSDLASLVQREGPLSVPRAIDCILQAAKGLAYAHERGIVHRDVKPSNLLLDQAGTLKVTDLGIARVVRAAGQEPSLCLTQPGGMLGTPDYMAPEQAEGLANIDHRADIYALGCTLHFLLAGGPPFAGTSGMAVVIKHRAAAPPSLLAVRPDVPAELDQIYRRMLAKSPDGRPQSMAEVADGLVPLLRPAPLPPAAVGAANADCRSAEARAEAAAVQDAPLPSVLVVEQSRVQSGIVRKYLEDQGIRVLDVVSSGQEALRVARASAPGCVVSSYHLPDMTGPELARQVRCEARAVTPGFVFISSRQTPSDSITQFSHALMVRKPFTAQQLGCF
jgi:serine/threonine protein kinase